MAVSSSASRRNLIALVTGGTGGIGLETCKQLASQGIDVIFTSRTEEKGKLAAQQIRQTIKEQSVSVDFLVVELGDLTSVSQACDQVREKTKYLDYLLLNAAVVESESREEPIVLSNGLEATFGVNHVAGTLMTLKLLPLMEETAKSENCVVKPMITFVSSGLHDSKSSRETSPSLNETARYLATMSTTTRMDGMDLFAPNHPNHIPYKGSWSYKYSKLLNVLTATALHKRLKGVIGCNSMTPGLVPASDLGRGIKKKLGTFWTDLLVWAVYSPLTPLYWMMRMMLGRPVVTLEEGAESEVYALQKGESGKYYRYNKEEPPSSLAQDEQVVDGMWEATLNLLKEKGYPINHSIVAQQ